MWDFRGGVHQTGVMKVAGRGGRYKMNISTYQYPGMTRFSALQGLSLYHLYNRISIWIGASVATTAISVGDFDACAFLDWTLHNNNSPFGPLMQFMHQIAGRAVGHQLLAPVIVGNSSQLTSAHLHLHLHVPLFLLLCFYPRRLHSPSDVYCIDYKQHQCIGSLQQ